MCKECGPKHNLESNKNEYRAEKNIPDNIIIAANKLFSNKPTNNNNSEIKFTVPGNPKLAKEKMKKKNVNIGIKVTIPRNKKYFLFYDAL